MTLSAVRQKTLRGAAVLATALSLAAVPTLASAATTSAEPGVHDYVECPVVQRGMGCGFRAVFPEGSWNVLFRYRDNEGKIQTEFDGGICTSATCQDFTFAIPRLDRVPLGYDVYTSAPIVIGRKFVRF